MPDYEDPAVEEQWCEERRTEVTRYLAGENVEHGKIGEWPAFHVAPYVSVWAIESKKAPGWVGWWVICGDLPTDYVSAKTIKHPRDALRSFAETWSEQAELMFRGETSAEITVGQPKDSATLAPLLKSRSKTLHGWANDDSIWLDDDL